MKKYTLIMTLLAAGCGEIPVGEEATIEESAALFPGQTFTRTIPPAPYSAGRRARWTPGAPLVPAGYSPDSFYYYYAGDLRNPNIIAAMGFDVRARRIMFEYDVDYGDMRSFLTEANNVSIIYALQARDDGGAGNITPKCCIGPGTDFPQQAWGTAWLIHEAHNATFQ